MAKESILFIILVLLNSIQTISYFAEANTESIIFVFHGLGANCNDIENYEITKLKEDGGFQYVYCANSSSYSDSYNQSMKIQVNQTVDKMKQIIAENGLNDKLQNGIFFYGISQGGLIARMIFNMFDEISKYVERIITFSSPNAGLQEVKMFNSVSNWVLNNLLKVDSISKGYSVSFYHNRDQTKQTHQADSYEDDFVYLNCIISFESVEQYIATELKNKPQELIDGFRERIAEKVETCADVHLKYSKLDMFVTIMNTDDNVIEPANSAIFGQEIGLVNYESIRNQNYKNFTKIQNQTEIFENNLYQKPPNMRTKNETSHLEFLKYLQDLMTQNQTYMGSFNKTFPNFIYSTPKKLDESLFYTHNYISISDLSLNNRYLACSLPGVHLQMGPDLFTTIISRLLSLNIPKYKNYSHIGSNKYPFVLDTNKLDILRYFCNISDLIKNQISQEVYRKQNNNKFLI